MNSITNDDWNKPSAFDDLDDTISSMQPQPKQHCEEILMECIQASLVHPQGRIKIKLLLYDPVREIEAVKFFNAKPGSNGAAITDKNSNFAKLYRLTTGENNKARYSKSHQLMNHLIGYSFYCIFEKSFYSNGEPFYKVTYIRSKNAVLGEDWTASGTLKSKPRNRKYQNKNRHKTETRQSKKESKPDKKWKKTGNTNIPLTPINTWDGDKFEVELKNQPVRDVSYENTPSNIIENKDKTLVNKTDFTDEEFVEQLSQAIWYEYDTGELAPF